MSIEKKFIEKAVTDLKVKRFLEKELENAGVSSIAMQKTPLATRIAIRVRRPSMVIGKRGQNIKAVTEILEKEFKIVNPQLDVIEVENASLDSKLVAERIARQIEIEGKIKQIVRMSLQDVMEAGAMGCEIIVAGKVVGKGGKAKSLRARKGYLKKAGEVKRMVMEARHTAYLKAGAIGITVRIVLPGTVFPDSVKLNFEEVKKQLDSMGEAPVEAEKQPEAAPAPEKKKEFREQKPKKKRIAPRKEKVEKKPEEYTGGPLVHTKPDEPAKKPGEGTEQKKPDAPAANPA